MYNTLCGICQSGLTPENTKPGFGVCTWRSVGGPQELREPFVTVQHLLVCLHCEPQAKQRNERYGIKVYDADGPSLWNTVQSEIVNQFSCET